MRSAQVHNISIAHGVAAIFQVIQRAVICLRVDRTVSIAQGTASVLYYHHCTASESYNEKDMPQKRVYMKCSAFVLRRVMSHERNRRSKQHHNG